jgi:hypothetical protein
MAENKRKKFDWKKFYEKNKGLVWISSAIAGVGILYLIFRATSKRTFAPTTQFAEANAGATKTQVSSSSGASVSAITSGGSSAVSGQFPLRYQTSNFIVVEEVRQLQKALNKFYGAGIGEDGKFGNQVKNAMAKIFPNLSSTEIPESTYRLILSGQAKNQVVNTAIDRTYVEGLMRILERDKTTLATLKKEQADAGFNIGKAATIGAEIGKLEAKIKQTETDIAKEKAKMGLAGAGTMNVTSEIKSVGDLFKMIGVQ